MSIRVTKATIIVTNICKAQNTFDNIQNSRTQF